MTRPHLSDDELDAAFAWRARGAPSFEVARRIAAATRMAPQRPAPDRLADAIAVLRTRAYPEASRAAAAIASIAVVATTVLGSGGALTMRSSPDDADRAVSDRLLANVARAAIAPGSSSGRSNASEGERRLGVSRGEAPDGSDDADDRHDDDDDGERLAESRDPRERTAHRDEPAGGIPDDVEERDDRDDDEDDIREEGSGDDAGSEDRESSRGREADPAADDDPDHTRGSATPVAGLTQEDV